MPDRRIIILLVSFFLIKDSTSYIEEIPPHEKEVLIEEVPYHVSIEVNGKHTCSGAIINQNYVLTVAHCVENVPVHNITIRAGTSNEKEGGILKTIKATHVHPKYDRYTFQYDIGLVEFQTPLTFEQTIQPVDIPNNGEKVPPGTLAFVSGWGMKSSGDFHSEVLQGVFTPIFEPEICTESYSGYFLTDGSMICAGSVFVSDELCPGEPGSPLLAGSQLVGIMSWGQNCLNSSVPSIFMSVPGLRDFIANIAHI